MQHGRVAVKGGDALARFEKAATTALMWTIGDWWAYGKAKYGDARAVAARLGFARGTVHHANSVARVFESCMRIQNLSWEHHHILAATLRSDPDTALRVFEVSDRSENLSWKHHRIIASTMRADPDLRYEYCGQPPNCTPAYPTRSTNRT